MGRVIDVAPGTAALNADRALGRIDADALHARQIDDQTAVAGAQAGAVVAAAADGERELVLAGGSNGAGSPGPAGGRGEQRPGPGQATVGDHRGPDAAAGCRG